MKKVMICRCEDVFLDEVEVCLAATAGPVSATEVKLRTRAGMGMCQGRTCGPLIAAVLRARAEPLGAVDLSPSPNPPVRPMTLGELAAARVRPDEAQS